MAETELYTMINNNNPQVVPKNPNKMYTHFLYKAVFVSMFLLLVPLFRCEVPDFMNQTIINTRSWELVQLVFVGIAVSYGLFSKRNKDEETQKGEQEEEGWSCCRIKTDHNAYVARLLQVSSVFDDDDEDSETPSGSGSGSGSGCDPSNNNRNSKVQTWNSQYYRGEPILVVAKDISSQQAAAVEKPPLLLPAVGSLKNECFSRSSSRRNLSKVTRGSTPEEEEEEENIVLRSPIPWRSRSAGRMDPYFTQQTPSADPPSLSEIQSKSLQDDNKSSFSPIPPPPPPPQVNLTNTYYSPKEFRGIGRSLSEKDFHNNNNNRGRRSRTSGVTTPTDHIHSPLPAKSKSFTSPKQTEYLLHDNEIESFIQTRGSQSNNRFMTTHHHQVTQHYYPKQEFMELTNKDHVEESEDDELQQLASKNNITGEMDINGPDVDKKADEFIAKFREQIRLQRIASIRTSTTTAQTPPN